MHIIPNETKQCGVISCLTETDECIFSYSPQLVPGNLVRLDGPPALKNLNMVDTIKAPPGTQPIQSRPYELNPVLSKQADAPISQPTSFSTPRRRGRAPLCASRRNRVASESQSTTKNLTRSPRFLRLRSPASTRCSTPSAADRFSPCSNFFSGFTQLTIHPDTIPLTAFCTPNGLYEWLRMPQGAAGAPAWFVSVMRLVTAGLDNIWMYLDDAIGSDDCPIHHVATLATFFERLRLHKLKLSPDISRIGAARVDFLGHVISADGVRPNDDRVAALTRMPMPTDIKQLRSLSGGLSYYRKSLPNIARHIRPIAALLKKGRRVRFQLRNGGYRSCPSRGTRSTPNTCLPGLGRGYRHVSALPPPLRRQHRWPRSHSRTRTTGWLHTPHRLNQPSHP